MILLVSNYYVIIITYYADPVTGRNTVLARPSVRPVPAPNSITKRRRKPKIGANVPRAAVTDVQIFRSRLGFRLGLRSSRRTAA